MAKEQEEHLDYVYYCFKCSRIQQPKYLDLLNTPQCCSQDMVLRERSIAEQLRFIGLSCQAVDAVLFSVFKGISQ